VLGPRCLVGCLLPLAPHQLVETLTSGLDLRDDRAVSVQPQRRRPWLLGLRARITAGFSLLGLLVSVGLSLITLAIVGPKQLDSFDTNQIKLAESRASNLRDKVRRAPGVPIQEQIDKSFTPEKLSNEFVSVLIDGQWIGSPGRITQLQAEPRAALLMNEIGKGSSGRQRVRIDSIDYLVVAIAMPTDKPDDLQATFLQGFDLKPVQTTLNNILLSLALASAIATVGASSIGLWTSRRVLRPLSRVTEAATRLAAGGFDTRLRDESDPELQRLAVSFNNMADAVQQRIQREARFASDVSHELRTPLQTLIGSIEMLDARKADLPDRSRQALELLVGQTKRFHQMVLDLLEISRLDAGAADLHTEPVLLDQFVSRVASRYGYAHVPVITEPRWQQQPVVVDRRRLERALANLLGNAENHAGGPVQMTLSGANDACGHHVVRVGVEDAGPGVADAERERIFERFARGATARHRAGTGLGLALVHEHIQLQGGRVWVEDRPKGDGARFVIELPAEDE
jgi:two-component system, OmpR family, sensor histidine kinase MtrB